MRHIARIHSSRSYTSAASRAPTAKWDSRTPSCMGLIIAAAITLLSACAPGLRQPAMLSIPGESAAADTLTPILVAGIDFGDARAVASDPLGFLYVADAGRHVVVKLRPTGAVERVLGGPGSSDGEFDEPSGIDPTNGLILLVADAGNRRIQKFSRSYAFLGSVPLTLPDDEGSSSRVTYRQNDGDNGGVASGRPIAVASSGAKDLYAIDADRNVVLKWDDNLGPAGVIGDMGAGRGALAEPIDLALGEESRVYVADRGRRGVIVFDAFGSVIRAIGEGRMDGIWAIATGEDALYVGRNNRIDVYAFDGALVSSHDLALRTAPVDLTLTPDGTLYLISARNLFELPRP